MSGLRIVFGCLVGLSIFPSVSNAASYENGFLWNRSQDWSGGSIPGSSLGNPDDDKKGSLVWEHSISTGGNLASETPWFSQPHSLLVWDDYWFGNGGAPVWARGYAGPESSPSENRNLNPPISRWALTHDVSTDFGSWQYVPQIRWHNPVGDGAIVDVFTYGGHPLIMEWAGGDGTSPNFVVEFVISRFDQSKDAYDVLFSTSVSNPSPGLANPPFPQVGIPVSLRGVRFDQGDQLVYSFRILSEGPVGLNWVNLYDHPFYMRLVGVVPEPESWMSFVGGLGLIGFLIRRKRKS